MTISTSEVQTTRDCVSGFTPSERFLASRNPNRGRQQMQFESKSTVNPGRHRAAEAARRIAFLLWAAIPATAQNTPVNFTAAGQVTPAAGWSFAAGTFDGCGAAILVGCNPGNGSLWSSALTASGFEPLVSSMPELIPSAGWSIAAGDLNGNGQSSLILYQPGTGTIWVGTRTSSDFDLHQQYVPSAPGAWNMAVGDFDGDGTSNLALYYPGDGSLYVGTWAKSQFTFGPKRILDAPGELSMVAGDIDGDGKSELIIYRPANGSLEVGIWDSETSAFAFSPRGTLAPSAGWTIVAGDFNGNGEDELAAYYPGDRSLWIGPMLAPDSLLEVGSLAPEAGASLTVGDFDGDGRDDLMACNASDGTLLVTTPGGAGPALRWASVQSKAAFPPLDGGGALTFGGRMWLLGGWAYETLPAPYTSNEIWESTNGVDWTSRGAAPWEPRHTAGYVVHQGMMWVLGGDANSGHYQNDVWKSADGVQWTQVASDVPWGNRVLHHVVEFDGKIWVMGGQKLPLFLDEDSSDEMLYNDVWNSTDGANWTRVLEHAPWAPRGMIGGCVVFNDRMWVLGGGTYETDLYLERTYYNDIWTSSDGIEWTMVSEHAPWQPRQYHNVAVFDNRMWVFGGYHNGNLNDVWSSSDGIDWVRLPGTPWPARHAASVYVHNDALWMVAGNLWNDVWRLKSSSLHLWPEQIAPVDGATGVPVPVDLAWLHVAGATGYDYQVLEGTQVISLNAGAPIRERSVRLNLAAGESYAWRVRRRGSPQCSPWSPYAVFTTQAESAAPSLLLPPPNAEDVEVPCALTWGPVTGASGYRVSCEKNGQPPIEVTFEASTLSWVPPLELGETYCWRVQPVGGKSSPLWKFSTQFAVNAVLAAPELLTPANPSNESSREVRFSWAAVPLAEGYDFQVCNASQKVDFATTDATSLRRFLQNGDYRWRARAAIFSTYERGPWSEFGSFSISAGTDVYNRRGLQMPPLGIRLDRGTVFLRWQSQIGQRFRFQYSTDLQVWTPYKDFFAENPESELAFPAAEGNTTGFFRIQWGDDFD